MNNNNNNNNTHENLDLNKSPTGLGKQLMDNIDRFKTKVIDALDMTYKQKSLIFMSSIIMASLSYLYYKAWADVSYKCYTPYQSGLVQKVCEPIKDADERGLLCSWEECDQIKIDLSNMLRKEFNILDEKLNNIKNINDPRLKDIVDKMKDLAEIARTVSNAWITNILSRDELYEVRIWYIDEFVEKLSLRYAEWKIKSKKQEFYKEYSDIK